MSLSCVAASVLWAVAFGFILAGTIVGIANPEGSGPAVSIALLAHGLAFSAAAATATVRAMLESQARFIQEAFQLGRDTAPMRRVQ